jgi:Protein of unknown function (DUF1778)
LFYRLLYRTISKEWEEKVKSMAKQISRDEQKDNHVNHDEIKTVTLNPVFYNSERIKFLAEISVQKLAYKPLEKVTVIRLSAHDQLRLVEALLNPPPIAPALEKAMADYKRRIKESAS